MDWLDLLAVQRTIKSLLQYHSSKASILWCSAFLIVHLSHPYMTTGKTIALTRRTFVGKVTSLFSNMLSRLVITFLPRSKCLNFMAAVTICSDFGAQENCLSLFPLFPHLFAMKWWDRMPWSYFLECWVLSQIFSLFSFIFIRASLVAQTVKHLSTMRETWVWFLGWEDPLEKEMATHSSTLAWKVPWTEEPDRLQSMGSQRVDTTERLHFHFHLHQEAP